MTVHLSNAIRTEEWSTGRSFAASEIGSLRTEVVQREDQFERLGSEWDELFRRSGSTNPFLRFEWLLAWWRQWGQGSTLWVILVRDRSGRLVATAPCHIARRGTADLKGRALCWLAHTFSGSDYLTVVVEPGWETAAARAIVSEVLGRRSEWDFIEWDHTLEDEPVIRALREGLRAAGCRELTMPRNVCPYAALPRTFEEYLKSLSQNVRYNFKRRLKALQKEGPLTLVALRRPPEIEARFGDLVRLHGARFTSQERASSFLAPDVLTFHRGTLQACTDASIPRLFLLELRGAPIAALYGFSMGTRFLFFQSGMDPEWSRLSVGLVMMGSVIEQVIRDGHTEFDFLRGEEAYKFQWATGVRTTSIIQFFDCRPLSRWVYTRRRVRRQLARLKAAIVAFGTPHTAAPGVAKRDTRTGARTAQTRPPAES